MIDYVQLFSKIPPMQRTGSGSLNFCKRFSYPVEGIWHICNYVENGSIASLSLLKGLSTSTHKRTHTPKWYIQDTKHRVHNTTLLSRICSSVLIPLSRMQQRDQLTSVEGSWSYKCFPGIGDHIQGPICTCLQNLHTLVVDLLSIVSRKSTRAMTGMCYCTD